MDDNEDGTNFSDDDLDALPDKALVELEQNAIQSTQQPARRCLPSDRFAQASARYDGPIQKALVPQRIQPCYEDFESEHLDNRRFEDAGIATPVEEVEEYIQSNLPGEVTQHENWRQERFGHHRHPDALKQPQKAVQQPPTRHVDPRESGHMEQERDIKMQGSILLEKHAQPDAWALSWDQELALRGQIADLLRERDRLTAELHDAYSTVVAQRGEIAIVRSNQNRESKIHQREVAALKKSYQEDAAKYKAEIEAANEESRRIISEKQFLQRELEEEETKT